MVLHNLVKFCNFYLGGGEGEIAQSFKNNLVMGPLQNDKKKELGGCISTNETN
jgi:hypothetical protein